jgi:YABBY protein
MDENIIQLVKVQGSFAADVIDQFVVFLSDKDITLAPELVKEFLSSMATNISSSFKVACSDRKGKSRDKDVVRRTRKPSTYNLFIKDEIARIKETNPELQGSSFLKKATEVWKAEKADKADKAEKAAKEAKVEADSISAALPALTQVPVAVA